MDANSPTMYRGHPLDSLQALVQRLYEPGPEGCPWANAQTLDSLAPFLLEEAREAFVALQQVQSIPSPTSAAIHLVCAEVGDVLWVVLQLAQLMERRGWCTLPDLLGQVEQKYRTRNRLVLAGARPTLTAVNADWANVKRAERMSTHG